MINGQIFFDQPVKNDLRTTYNTQKKETDQGDDYPTDCLLDYNYFKEYYKMKLIDLSKEQPHDTDPKAIKQINFIVNLAGEWNEGTTMFFIIKEAKKSIRFFKWNRKTIANLFFFNIILIKIDTI